MNITNSKEIRMICFIMSILLIVGTLGAAVKPNQTLTTDVDWWPHFRHDSAHTGTSSSSAIIEKMEWSIPLYTSDSSSVVYNNKIYVISGSLYCLNTSDGSELWNYTFPSPPAVPNTPMIYDGKLYIGLAAPAKTVYCLNAEDGTLINHYILSSGLGHSPTEGNDKIFFASSQAIYCFNSLLTYPILWKFPTSGSITTETSPSYANGYVYFGANNKKVYCLNAETGAKVWENTTYGMVRSSPAVYDQSVYVGSDDGTLYCFNVLNGSLRWNRYVGGSISSSPALANNHVFFGTSYGRFYCLDTTTGSVIWNTEIGGSITSSPALAANKIYISVNSAGDDLYRLDASTGIIEWSYDIAQGTLEASPALANGKLYINGFGKLFCFGESINSAPENPTTPFGPTLGNLGGVFSFTTSSQDFDGDAISYSVDWGDGVVSGWTTPLPSGETISISHSWTKIGNYSIRVKAKDAHGRHSNNWSDPLSITIIPNTPPEKPSLPLGPVQGYTGENIIFTTNTTDIEENQLWYKWRFGSAESEWLGPTDSGVTTQGNHIWTSSGFFNVKVKAKDLFEESDWSDSFSIIILDNEFPQIPIQPSGPQKGIVGTEYLYSTVAIDPDEQQLQYGWDWNNDDEVDEWTSFSASGTSSETSHIFQHTGVFLLKVKARDSSNAETSWSEALEVSIHSIQLDPPSGPTQGNVGVEYQYNGTIPESLSLKDYYVLFDWNDTTENTWQGPYLPGTIVSMQHIWSDTGTYTVRIKLKDDSNLEGEWSIPLQVVINAPPLQPDKPVGNTQGEPGDTIMFSTKSTDPNSDQICYGWDWNNDAIADEWTELFDSGATIQTTHVFPNAGTYTIKVIAKDTHDACSSWSEPLTVIITQKTPLLTIESITGGKEGIITAVIKNTGTAAAINVSWIITIEGGLKIFVNQSQGSIDTLAVDTTSTLTLTGKKFLGVGLGFGKILPSPIITVKVSADNTSPVALSATARIFFKSITIM